MNFVHKTLKIASCFLGRQVVFRDVCFPFLLFFFKPHSIKSLGSYTSSTAKAVPLLRARRRLWVRGLAHSGAFPNHGEGLCRTRSPDGDATGIPRLRAPEHGEGLYRGAVLDMDATGIPRLRAPEHGEGFYVRGPAHSGAFPRGEGAELARRMRCRREESLAGLGFSAVLCDESEKKKRRILGTGI